MRTRRTFRPAFSRPFSAHALVLLLAVATVLGLLAPAAVEAQCTTATRIDDVLVRVRTGSPPSSDTTRREHVRITPELAADLCIGSGDVASNGDRSPQVRVHLTQDPVGGSSPASAAVFTVTSLAGSSVGSFDRVLEVWNAETSSDTNNGRVKLFPASTSASQINNVTALASVYRTVPHRTTELEYWLYGRKDPVVTTHYADPNNDPDHAFEEFIDLGVDQDVAVLVPHGGNIEPGLSERIGRVLQSLELYSGTEADAWEGFGTWGSGQTFRRWHVTSGDYGPDHFPGLSELTDRAAVSPYDYALAIHGFGEDTHKAVIIGGQSSLDEKCELASRMQNRFHGKRDQVAITIFHRSSGGGVLSLNVPNAAGATFGSRTDLRGFDSDNIVNRLAPNPTHAAGFGTFQVELSKALRDDDTLMDGLMSGLGGAVGRLHAYPPDAQGACADLVYP